MVIFSRLGTLRIILLLATAICYPLVWLSDSEPEGIGIFTAYVAPSLVVIFFFVLLLDALMNRVFMIEQTEEVRRVARTRIWFDLAAVAGLILFWWPYFRDIGAL